MITIIFMVRYHLITTEDMNSRCSGKTVFDDLESVFEDLQFGKTPDRFAEAIFLPKLTLQELTLVERKDLSYMKSFLIGERADVPVAKMKLSESDSKFVFAFANRETYLIDF